MGRRFHRAFLLYLAAAMAWADGTGAATRSLEETFNLILTGSSKDRMGLVEIEDADDCVVKLRNRKTDDFALLRFNNVDPRTIAVAGRRGNRYLSFSGPGVIVELHGPESGLWAVSDKVQISARNADRERRNLERLYAEFCAGRPRSGAAAGS